MKGSVDDEGVMNVQDYLFCHDFSNDEKDEKDKHDEEEDFVLILSGIGIGGPDTVKTEMDIHLLGDFLSGVS